MQYIKFTSDEEKFGCEMEGNPLELAEAIFHAMVRNETVRDTIKAAVLAYEVVEESNQTQSN